MGVFASQLGVLNQAVKDTFASEQVIYQRRTSNTNTGSPLTLQCIPIDPLRLEGLATGNFAVRWVQTRDLVNEAGQPFAPHKGDIATIPASAITVGGTYTVIQVQEDIGGGVRLVLERRT